MVTLPNKLTACTIHMEEITCNKTMKQGKGEEHVSESDDESRISLKGLFHFTHLH